MANPGQKLSWVYPATCWEERLSLAFAGVRLPPSLRHTPPRGAQSSGCWTRATWSPPPVRIIAMIALHTCHRQSDSIETFEQEYKLRFLLQQYADFKQRPSKNYPTCACFMSVSEAADCWRSKSSLSMLHNTALQIMTKHYETASRGRGWVCKRRCEQSSLICENGEPCLDEDSLSRHV